MSWTQQDFIDNTRQFLDGESSSRWSNALITSVGDVVMQNEWSAILNQNQYYRLANVSVTTDASGRVAISSLTTGTGDTAQNFYRVLTGFSDGNILWKETDLRYVPLGTQTNYQNPYEYLYYLAGSDYFQLLPVASGTALTVMVNWTPTTIGDLAGVTSVIDYPRGYEWILAWVAAATLLLKGGAESQAATDLFSLADDARKSLMGDVGRLTVRPTSALFNDSPAAWMG